MHLFYTWHIARNQNPDAVPVLADLDHVETIEKHFLSNALCRFITEVRKLNGDRYPPKTIYEMIVCIQMHLETQGIF